MRLLALTLLTTLLASGCDSITGASNIEYRVSGTATRVSLTYETEGGTSQVASVALPWSYSRRATKGDFLYISAQIVQGTGTVTTSIYKGSDLFKTSSSSGFASIASASGSLD